MSELPAGFVLDKPVNAPAALPPGFVLDGPATAGGPMNDPAAVDSDAMRTPMTNETSLPVALGQYAGGVLDQAGRGLANGVMGVVALPNSASQINRNVVDYGLKKLGAPDWTQEIVKAMTPSADYLPSYSGMTGAVDSANNMTADALGVERPRGEPENLGERFASKIGEFVGGAAIPVGGVVGTAEKMGVEGARAYARSAEGGGMLSRLFPNMVETAAVNPGKFVGNELAANAAAGGGAATMNTIDDPNTWHGKLAEILGSLAGVGVMGAARATGAGAKQLLNAYRSDPKFASEVVRDKVADTLVQNSAVMAKQVDPTNMHRPLDTSELVQAIQQPAAIEQLAPGFRASTADHAGDTGLALLESARARSNPSLYAGQADQNVNAVEGALGQIAPKEPAATFRDALVSERDRRMMEAINGQTQASDAASAALGPLQPTMQPAQRGSTIRTALETAEQAAKDRVAQQYAAIDMNGRMVNPAPLTQAVDSVSSNLNPIERGLAPQGQIESIAGLGRGGDEPIVSKILGPDGNPIVHPAPGPDPIPLKAANDLRSELGRLKSAAAADWRAERGGNNAARVINQYQEAVDRFIGQNLTPEEQTALADAKAQLHQMKDDFTRQGDPIAGVLARNDGGAPKVRDDMVASKLANGPEMDRLFQYADSPEVRQAIRDEVLSKGDFSSPEKITQFQQRYADQLKRFPGLSDELNSAAKLQGTAREATANRTTLERDLGTDTIPGRSAVGKYAQFSNVNSGKAIQEVIRDKDPVKAVDSLMEFVGNEPTAVDGLRKAFWEHMDSNVRAKNAVAETKSGVMPVVGKKLVGFLDDPVNAAVAERLYRDNPEHLANLRKLGEALKGVGLGPKTGNAVNPSGTGLLSKGSGVTAAEVGSKLYQANIGRASYAYIGAYLAGKIARHAVSKQHAAAFDQLLDKALVDPEAAAALLKENNPANRAALARNTKTWLGNEGMMITNMLGDDDPTTDAVMRKK